MRVLAVKRISRDTESSSALERQGLALAEAIRAGRHELAGWVEDATVSGAVNLDQRPSLGQWLNVPLVHEWDALMVTTQDRISRDDMHWWQFIDWVLKNEKTILVLDDPSFNINDPDGRMIAGIKATQAANYRNAVRQKKLNQTRYYRDEGLWDGGTWPYGYRAIPYTHNGAQRKRLAIDPITGPMVREAYDRIVNKGESLGSIAKDWTKRGVHTALDHMRHINEVENLPGKRGVKGHRWATSTMTSVFTKQSLMGYAMHKGEPVRKGGLPVVWADPLLTEEEWKKLQEVMTARAKGKGGPARTATPLSGVVFCKCGAQMHSNSSTKKLKNGSTREYHYYMCRTWHGPKEQQCKWVTSWPKSYIENFMDDLFLANAGELEITSRTYVPGVDKSGEISRLTDAIDNLTGNLTALKPGSAAAQSVLRSMEEHEAAIETLKAVPVIPARWVEEGTGKTYRQEWESKGWEERGELLRKSGIRLILGGVPGAVRKIPEHSMFFPEHLAKRLADAHAGTVEPGFLEQWSEFIQDYAKDPTLFTDYPEDEEDPAARYDPSLQKG